MTVSSRRRFVAASSLALLSAGLRLVPAGEATAQSLSDNRSRGPDNPIDVLGPEALERQAQAILPPGAFAFVARGAGDEWTLAENRRAFNDFSILTRRFGGTVDSAIDLTTRLLSEKLTSPILVNPMGAQIMVHPEAEEVTAAGAGRADVLYTICGASNLPIEQIAKASNGPKWFQTYLNSDAGVSRDILLRARDAGAKAIVLTADALGPGTSDEFIRLGRPFSHGMTFGNYDPRYGGRGDFFSQKTNLSFDDIGWIRNITGLPVVAKGILRPSDAKDAISAGAAAIQVSNHGGRQIDGVPASISMLPSVADAVGARVPVILDSGVRRGIDVLRALALGATAVGVGRPVLYGAALGGARGVESVLDHLKTELHMAMLLAGAQSVGAIDRNFIMAPTACARRG